MSSKEIALSLQELITLLKESNLLSKEWLTFQEAVKVFGFREDHLYKLTQSRSIPFHKPSGKLIWFRKSEVEAWIAAGKIKTSVQLTNELHKTGKEAVHYGRK